MIYLDYQATTPLAPEVAKAMQPWIEEKFANPHSPSRWGREADAAVDVARSQVERAIGLRDGSVAFTGSATEALNWALKGSVEKAPQGRNRIVTVATEHAAVLDTCEWLTDRGVDLTILPVKPDGLIDLEELERELDDRVLLVAVMLVNNEIGVIQPVTEIARMAHDAGALMLCDAVQGFGRIEIPEDADLVAISAHKIHGPKGIGALWMRKGCEPATSQRHCCTAAGRSGRCAPEPCHRRCASASAKRPSSRRAGRRATTTMSRSFGPPRFTRLGPAGRSMAIRATAITAISTSAAKASMGRG